MRRNEPLGVSAAVSLVLTAILFLLPAAAVRPFQGELYAGEGPPRESEGTAGGVTTADGEAVLRVLDNGTVREMDLGTYLAGVVRAEMPASFEPEALKAQAVAARTYTLYQLLGGGRHGETADICTDPACCQAWLGEEQAQINWGAQAEEYGTKIRRAVAETDGQAVLYEGEPILAAFHSSSPGRTRTADTVWQTALPYLQPVESPETGERIPNYYSRAEFTAEELRAAVLAAYPEADLSGSPETWLKDAQRDSAGNVETLRVGGVAVKGSRLRSLLGLRSACFTWEAGETGFVFFVTGYGHGVGLSQYGADRMAAGGADYREILTHYYTGVTVEVWPVAERFTNSA